MNPLLWLWCWLRYRGHARIKVITDVKPTWVGGPPYRGLAYTIEAAHHECSRCHRRLR